MSCELTDLKQNHHDLFSCITKQGHTAVVDWLESQNSRQILVDRQLLQTATTSSLQSETMDRILAAAAVRCLAESEILVGHRRLGIVKSFAQLR